MDERVEQLGTAKAEGLGSHDLHDIGQAAEQGRVSTLLIAESAYEQTLGSQGAQLADIADACNQVIKTDGEVFICDDRQMPGEATLAAIYRYKI